MLPKKVVGAETCQDINVPRKGAFKACLKLSKKLALHVPWFMHTYSEFHIIVFIIAIPIHKQNSTVFNDGALVDQRRDLLLRFRISDTFNSVGKEAVL